MDKPTEKVLQKTSHRKIFFDKILENGADVNDMSIRVKHLKNTRVNTADGAFRNSDIADDPCEIYYEVGSSAEIDAAAIFTMGFELKKGWTFLIKERICQKSRIDDLFVLVPGQRVPFRGKAMLVKNNLL